MEQLNKEFWSNTWHLSKGAVSYIIHIFLIAIAVFNVEVVYEFTHVFFELHPETHMRFNPHMMAGLLSLSIFFANLAGAWWVKQMYIQYVMPEVMEDFTMQIKETKKVRS